VDIGGPQLHGFLDHQLHHPHHGCAILINGFVVARDRCRLGFGKVDRRIGEFLEHRVRRFTFDLTVVLVDRFLDLVARRQGDFDLPIENEPQFFDRIDVVGIADDHLQRILILR
jgi:hypothetical protein